MAGESIAEHTMKGDARSAAFEEMMEAHLVSFYRLATVILGDPFEAEDATHDAAVRAWETWGSLRDAQRFDAWFHRILINECRDRLRKRRIRPLTVSLLDGAGLPTADAAAGLADRESLLAAMDQLTPDQRIAIVLRYYLGFDVADVARLTGVRPGTAKSRLHYALSSLRAAASAAARIEGGDDK